jgi:release factor glutamine methyltransferase
MSASIVNTLRAAGCVFAEDEARLLITSAATASELNSMVQQRVSGLPLEHIVGWAEFCGMRIAVDSGVFVPRRRTELLVREAAAVLRPDATVVDLGCGSGAVGAALRATVSIDLHAVDIDPAAVKCARRNLGPVVLLGDLYQPLPNDLRGHIDAIVANTPYVPTEAIRLLPAEARLHEQRVALDGGADGLEVLRRVVVGAPSWLASGGHLLIETSEDQAPAVTEVMLHHGLAARVSHCDELGATVVSGCFRGAGVPPRPAVCGVCSGGPAAPAAVRTSPTGGCAPAPRPRR